MRALIDGDILVYRAACAVEKTRYRIVGTFSDFDGEEVDMTFDYHKEMKQWLEDNPTYLPEGPAEKVVELEPVQNALNILHSMVKTLLRNTDADCYTVYLTGKGNFREGVAKQRPYKEKRPPKPTHYQACRDYLVNRYSAEVTDGQEADDALGITQCAAEPGTTVICSIDKDLLMIPGLHYNIVSEESTTICEDEAILKFWHQMITGDPTDTIPGLKGKGKKFADTLIEELYGDPESIYTEVAHLYEAQFGEDWKDVFNEMCQLLWIRREQDEMKVLI